MFTKGVFELINESDVPSKAHLLATMWRFKPKTDLDGFVRTW